MHLLWTHLRMPVLHHRDNQQWQPKQLLLRDHQHKSVILDITRVHFTSTPPQVLDCLELNMN